MSGRELSWWFDEDGTPRVSWVQLPDDPEPAPKETRYGELERRIAALTPKQRYVIELSWGLSFERSYSFREIGEFMGISHQSVHRLYGRGMDALRRGDS